MKNKIVLLVICLSAGMLSGCEYCQLMVYQIFHSRTVITDPPVDTDYQAGKLYRLKKDVFANSTHANKYIDTKYLITTFGGRLPSVYGEPNRQYTNIVNNRNKDNIEWVSNGCILKAGVVIRFNDIKEIDTVTNRYAAPIGQIEHDAFRSPTLVDLKHISHVSLRVQDDKWVIKYDREYLEIVD